MTMNETMNMYFGVIKDERCQCDVKHRLVDVLKLTMIGILCGTDELDKIVDYGNNKKEFLAREFGIKNTVKIDTNKNICHGRPKVAKPKCSRDTQIIGKKPT